MKNTLKAKSEISGSVWKVLVQPGQSVNSGDSLVVIESMKMEIPVLAEKSGKVLEIHVKEGEAVVTDQLIATIECA
jgi:acetyl-CoA carboxylase biotin carboxyl carrier protein